MFVNIIYLFLFIKRESIIYNMLRVANVFLVSGLGNIGL